jgi:D-alanyl-D-alanine carboxypeptidase
VTNRGRLPLLATIAAAALLAAGPSGGAPARPSSLGQIAQSLVAAGAPGALAVVRTPAGLRSGVAGLARLSPKDPLRVTDTYRVASVTKTFTAAVILQLAAENRLRLGDSIERWLPGTVPKGRSITLRELLSHTSGLFDYDEDNAWVAKRIANPARSWTPRELVKIATSHPVLFPPGTSWAYSNTNYVLLGLVVEAVTHRSLARELKDRIFSPLSLRSTSFPAGTAIPGHYVHGYVGSASTPKIPRGQLLDASTLLSPSAWGAGQIVSNAPDLTRFYAALLGGSVLPTRLRTQMTTEVKAYGYGLGLQIQESRCGRAVGHRGDFPGYRNVVWALAGKRRVAAVMVNVDTTHVPWNELDDAAFRALCTG